MVPCLLAPVTSTLVPTGNVPLEHPSVAVFPPVPEQWAAWPMYTVEPLVKMKFAVHCPPCVKVCTPGWMAAVAAGAHADAAGASTSVASTEAHATHSLSLFIYDPPAGRF